MGQIDVAKKYFLYIIKTYPFHAFAHYFLAMILKKNGQISKSEKHLTKVVEICKDDPKWLEYFNHFQINPYLCDYKFLETSVQLNTESLMA
jgi:tetratricopeptide (TPR) repeat protein